MGPFSRASPLWLSDVVLAREVLLRPSSDSLSVGSNCAAGSAGWDGQLLTFCVLRIWQQTR